MEIDSQGCKNVWEGRTLSCLDACPKSTSLTSEFVYENFGILKDTDCTIQKYQTGQCLYFFRRLIQLRRVADEVQHRTSQGPSRKGQLLAARVRRVNLCISPRCSPLSNTLYFGPSIATALNYWSESNEPQNFLWAAKIFLGTWQQKSM